MSILSRNDLDQSEERILKAIDKRFTDHEKLEMIIYKNIQKIIDRHDEFLIGENGNGGMKADVSKLDTSFKVLQTKLKTWYTVVSLFIGSGGLTVLYMIFTGP